MQKQSNRTLLAGTKHNYCLIRPPGFYMMQVFTETHWNVSLLMKWKFNFCYKHSSLIRYDSVHDPEAIILEENI